MTEVYIPYSTKLVFQITFDRHWSSEIFLEIKVSFKIIVTLPLVRWALPQKGNITSELWPKFFQDRFFTTYLQCEKLFAAALKCLGPPFSDTICHAEPLSSILFWVQNLIQSSVFILSQPCVMPLKNKGPKKSWRTLDFLLLFSHSDDSGVFLLWQGFLSKPRGEQRQTKKKICEQPLVYQRWAFQRLKHVVTYFTLGTRQHQVISLEIILSLSQSNYYFCFIYMNTAIMITAKLHNCFLWGFWFWKSVL